MAQFLQQTKLGQSKFEYLSAHHQSDMHLVTDEAVSSWEKFYQKLCQWKETNGTCFVLDVDDFELAQWCFEQRSLFHREPNGMTSDRIEKLTRLGFTWTLMSLDGRFLDCWEERFQELLNFKQLYGHTLVPRSQGALGEWVKQQRSFYKQRSKRLTLERIDKLNRIGFVWGVRHKNHQARIALLESDDVEWELQLHQFRLFMQTNGMMVTEAEKSTLADWVHHQLVLYYSEPMEISLDRVDRLLQAGLDLSMTMSVVDDNGSGNDEWDGNFQLLLEYQRQHGHCCVPKYHGDIGTWVYNQRAHYKKKALTTQQIEKLESIGFVWYPNKNNEWNNYFQLLVEYKHRHGHCRVPKGHGALGKWVCNQRLNYKRKTTFLTMEQIEKLEGVGFVWCSKRS